MNSPQTCRGERATRRQRLSVIIPTRNEELTIGPVLERVLEAEVWEVIVADGESTDRTCGIVASFGATVVRSKPGRGVQLNAGAAVATGDTYLFLHADTLVPARFNKYVYSVLARPGVSAGAFRLAIDSPERSLRLIEKFVYLRSRVLQMPYGDQAVFLTAEIFHRVGGFPDLPLMEDYVMARRLRHIGRIEIARPAVLTSPRCWISRGIWRTTLANQVCIIAYRLGVPADRLARWRGMSRRPVRDTDSTRP